MFLFFFFFVALHSLPLWKTKSGKRVIMFSFIFVRFSILSFERSGHQCGELLFLVKLSAEFAVG